MKRQTIIRGILGLAALTVIFSRCSREDQIELQRETPALIMEENVTEAAEIQELEAVETVKPEEDTEQIKEETEVQELPADQDSGCKEEGAETAETVVPTRPEMIKEAPVVEEKNPEVPVESEIADPTALDPQRVEEETADHPETVEVISEEAVDEIEGTLSVSDYAKGLTLLAKLPAETVDRFVELRKDGFTPEEQAEVKAILLESYEGEDLEWIVEMYHKLQP